MPTTPRPGLPAGAAVLEVHPPDTARTHAAMRELRPHLDNADAYVDQVDRVQRGEGYRLVAVFEAGTADAVAVAGFREVTNTHRGRHLYVDDLSTLPLARGRGYGRALLDWVHAEAARLGLAVVDLDSGVGESRATAHRLYHNAGYTITAFHFTRVAPPVAVGEAAAITSRRHDLVWPDDPTDRPRLERSAVRVIVLDDADRTLLLADSDPLLPQFSWWVTPGGGIDPGETEEAAAVRELAEETGLVLAETELIGPIARRRAVHGYSDQIIDQTETFYAVRVPAFAVSVDGHTEAEQVTLTGHRWWTYDELAASDAWVWPAELVRLWDLVTRPDGSLIDLGTVTDESTRPV